MARPTKLTPDVEKRITDAIRVGSTYTLAAQYGGVSYDAFNDWMNRGQQARSGKFYQFYHNVKKAEADGAMKWLAVIDKASAEQWQAAAWKLERRYPQDYGRTVHEHQGKDGGPIVVVAWGDNDGDDSD